MKPQLLASTAVVCCLFPILAVANPAVSANVISWPDNGWYQVQRSSDQVSLCQGGQSCEVPAGNYIVINHSTGQRFENVVVGEAASADDTNTGSEQAMAFTLSGNTISWPDDGWYQVQSVSSFESICEGGNSCTVADGNYHLINHTTGQRYENLQLPAGLSNGNPDDVFATETTAVITAVTTVGNTVRWPDNGWYQVQTADTFETVCEGGQQCDVPDGSYNVINLTTGARTENLTIGPGPETVAGEDSTPGVSMPAAEGSAIVPLTFLTDLGQAPYGNLPLVDMMPWTRSLRSIPEAVQARLPDDCLLDLFGSYFCYRPATRQLKAVLSNGDPFWSFNLPGENGSNRIDGISLTQANRLALVANITSEFGNPRHEVSFFSHTGEFQRTIDVLLLDNTRWPTFNIQGEPLIVSGESKNTLNQTWDLIVTGNTYELSPGGNRAIPADWIQTGTATATLDGQTGEYRQVSLCEGAFISRPETGAEPCAESTNNFTLDRNNAQRKLTWRLDSITTTTLETAGNSVVAMRDAGRNSGLVSDLPCVPGPVDGSCLTSLLPEVGNTFTSSTVSIECPMPSWNDDAFRYGNGTAELTQTLIRTSVNRVERHDELAFTDRCDLSTTNVATGQMTGNATVVSTINLENGSTIDAETRFEDLTSVIGDSVWRFHDGSFRSSDTGVSRSYQLTSTEINSGGVCNRSCPPSIGFFGTYSDLVLDIDKFSNGSYSYDLLSDFRITQGPPDALSVLPEQIQADVVYDTDTNILTGSVTLSDRDAGVRVRMSPVRNDNYPSLRFVEYELTTLDAPGERWSLPISAFTQGDITSTRVE